MAAGCGLLIEGSTKNTQREWDREPARARGRACVCACVCVWERQRDARACLTKIKWVTCLSFATFATPNSTLIAFSDLWPPPFGIWKCPPPPHPRPPYTTSACPNPFLAQAQTPLFWGYLMISEYFIEPMMILRHCNTLKHSATHSNNNL